MHLTIDSSNEFILLKYLEALSSQSIAPATDGEPRPPPGKGDDGPLLCTPPFTVCLQRCRDFLSPGSSLERHDKAFVYHFARLVGKVKYLAATGMILDLKESHSHLISHDCPQR